MKTKIFTGEDCEDGALKSGCNIDRKGVRCVRIGEGVKKICDSAFVAYLFESLIIEEGVTEIDDYAFWQCRSLRSIEIPSTVTKIGAKAFKDCVNIEKIVSHSPLYPFGEKMQHLYDATGRRRKVILTLNAGKKAAKKAKIEGLHKASATAVIESVLGEKKLPFVRAERIVKNSILRINIGNAGVDILLPDSDSAKWAKTLPSLLDFAKDCTDSADLRKYAIENGFEDASRKFICSRNGGVRVRKGTSPVHLSIPGGTTKIRKSAFNNCPSLSSVVIPEGVTEIESRAFVNCMWLRSVKIPSTVSKIRGNAFACLRLQEIEFGGTVSQWKALIEKDEQFLTWIPAKSVKCSDGECEKPVFLWVGDGKKRDFGLALGFGVTKIEDDAFSGDKTIANVFIPKGITEIGKNAFRNSSVRHVVLPEGLEKIGDGAFEGCGNLSVLRIQKSVKEIGARAFSGCGSMKVILFTGKMKEWSGVKKGADWNEGVPARNIDVIDDALTVENDIVISCRKDAEDVAISSGILAIAAGAFKGCASLKSVSIHGTVNEIGENAFDGCTSLSEINFRGTTSMWKAMRKGAEWNKDVPAEKVDCTNWKFELK